MAIIEGNLDNFKEEIKEGLVLVDFYATWCGPCKMIAPVLEEIDTEIGNEIKILKVDVDQNQSIANEYSVMSIPTLLLFKDGKVISKCVGFTPKEALIDWIENNK